MILAFALATIGTHVAGTIAALGKNNKVSAVAAFAIILKAA